MTEGQIYFFKKRTSKIGDTTIKKLLRNEKNTIVYWILAEGMI